MKRAQVAPGPQSITECNSALVHFHFELRHLGRHGRPMERVPVRRIRFLRLAHIRIAVLRWYRAGLPASLAYRNRTAVAVESNHRSVGHRAAQHGSTALALNAKRITEIVADVAL